MYQRRCGILKRSEGDGLTWATLEGESIMLQETSCYCPAAEVITSLFRPRWRWRHSRCARRGGTCRARRILR